MRSTEMKRVILEGALERYSALYADTAALAKRIVAAIEKFEGYYGRDRDISVFSVPGRSELLGNHTDHNNGCVLAGAIDRDIIAIAAKNDDGVVRFHSEGYPEDLVEISRATSPKSFRRFTSHALVGGIVGGFIKEGYKVGGYDAYSTTEVLKGSGISSSAAFEVMVGNVLNYFYNDGAVKNEEIAKIAQYSENAYFGKPCGLMDQMACAVGSFVYIDFKDSGAPIVEPIDFSLSGVGYSLCIVNTGGNHANLNDDYASVPAEMKAVAKVLGGEVLRGFTEADVVAKAQELRQATNDRAIMRALHFIRENERVVSAREALKCGDLKGFFDKVKASGASSFQYLQNVYTTKNPTEQGLSLALAITEGYLSDKDGAFRVHGGGFAGTIQAFVKNEDVDGYRALMDGVFGKGATMCLRIRPVGACKLI